MERTYYNRLTRTSARLVSCHTKKAKGAMHDQETLYTLRKGNGAELEVAGAQLHAGWVWQHAPFPPRRNHRSSTRAARRHPTKERKG